MREELNTRELLVREAKKKGLDKNPDVKNQMDLAAQTVLVRAYVADWMKANPVPDAVLHKEYDTIKTQIGDKEYKVRHILVEKEDEAKEIIAALQKGDKFEKLAERSKDPGSKDNGGDLDWNAPGNFVKPFSDAMVKMPKGKFTPQPVQTQFGWHVIEVDDIRDAKVPTLRRSEAAAPAADAGAGSRRVLQGSAREERRVATSAVADGRQRPRAGKACPFFASAAQPGSMASACAGLRCSSQRRGIRGRRCVDRDPTRTGGTHGVHPPPQGFLPAAVHRVRRRRDRRRRNYALGTAARMGPATSRASSASC